MNLDDQIPVLIRHILEADIAQYASIVQEHIYPAKGLDGGVDNLVAILNAIIIRDSFASSSSDLVDNHIRCLRKMSVMVIEKPGRRTTYFGGAALAFKRASEIIDDDICAS